MSLMFEVNGPGYGEEGILWEGMEAYPNCGEVWEGVELWDGVRESR